MAGLLLAVPSGYSEVSTNQTFGGLYEPIPDGALTGWSDTRTISLPGGIAITDITVSLVITGGFNGDLYGYLAHGDNLAVLLNRPGRTESDPAGYWDAGFDVTFTVAPGNDIHSYRNWVSPFGPVTGLWEADGRNVHPWTVLESTTRTATLDVFLGNNPNGEWMLFLADVDFGGQAGIVEWGLQLKAVPEPGTIGLMLAGLAALGFVWRYRPGHRRLDVGRR